MLLGSHAFGRLLNSLGVHQAENPRSGNTDKGGLGTISLAIPTTPSFLGILRSGGFSFVTKPDREPTPQLSSYRERGRVLKVRLLVPLIKTNEPKTLPRLTHTQPGFRTSGIWFRIQRAALCWAEIKRFR
ncbi:hypothetical protein [Paraburkholderia caribensis]|uniref:hypothetical protein n=1 Tax=Paraburkholderia caribensis TaxID=75105 RepID=UPI003AAEB981